jgi:hypothetical protein
MPIRPAVLKARLDAETKAAFSRRATARGLSESELLRAVVLAEIRDGAPTAPAPAEPDSERTDVERLTVRLPAFLLDAVKARGAACGLATSRWIAALVQSNLTRQPVLTDDELSAVQAANRELAAVGRNLNQIARALNEAVQGAERVRLDTLAELAAAIERDRQAIRALVRASRQAWKGESE